MASAIKWSRTEAARLNHVKSHGVHFTPPALARFLARHALAYLPSAPHYTILDPACGDGELLAAILDEVSDEQRNRLTLIGVDRDPAAVTATERRLLSASPARVEIHQFDFLANRRANGTRQLSLLESPPSISAVPTSVDLIISNPPYVRTQVLGASVAKKLAAEYDLSGRVDLYHAFVRGMTDHLAEGGILGLLCSNRFLTTQGGAVLRDLLWSNYELCEVFDLGDTKLFTAAVLPAIIIAQKRTVSSVQDCSFVRIYETRDGEGAPTIAPHDSIPEAIDAGAEGVVAINGLSYKIERGTLFPLGEPRAPWTMSSRLISDWLAVVEQHTECTFGDCATIRVGIKTTADSVFIRTDWETLPLEQQPESELLHPLLTHFVAERWRGTVGDSRRVLYPHAIENGRRRAISLDAYPRARAYLDAHRERLQARTYVIESGRQWYEIWVPQNPGEWSRPKIVFPDISEKPRFFLDTCGAIVNGDCYWIALDGTLDLEMGYLMLAVANSSFAVKFYDAVCSNRLYSGRRRFITQYVNRFPLPRLTSGERAWVRKQVEQLVQERGSSEDRAAIEVALDAMIWHAFGSPEVISRETNL